MSKEKKKVSYRNSIKVMMMERFGKTETVMRDRRKRRPKDKRNSWENEEY